MITRLTFLCWLVTLLIPTNAANSQQLPKTSEFQQMLTVCAAGQKFQLKADLLGSITSLYEKDRTNGTAVLNNESEFLKSIPSDQKLEAYKLYLACIKDFIVRHQESSKEHYIKLVRFGAHLSLFIAKDECGYLQKELPIPKGAPKKFTQSPEEVYKAFVMKNSDKLKDEAAAINLSPHNDKILEMANNDEIRDALRHHYLDQLSSTELSMAGIGHFIALLNYIYMGAVKDWAIKHPPRPLTAMDRWMIKSANCYRYYYDIDTEDFRAVLISVDLQSLLKYMPDPLKPKLHPLSHYPLLNQVVQNLAPRVQSAVNKKY